MLDEIKGRFEDKNVEKYCFSLLKGVPEYFWTVPASSSGKYHPEYALGEGGLVRHTCALLRILDHILSLESTASRIGSRERDLLRVAAIMHDTFKSGTQEDYEKSVYTKHDHPNIAAEYVKKSECEKYGVSEKEKDFVASVIRTHMGQWNISERCPVVLDKPSDKYQNLLHQCDYLASRKDIEIKF